MSNMISWREERRVSLGNWPSTARRSCTIKSQTNLRKACLTQSTAWRCLPTLLMARAFDSSYVIIIVIIYSLTTRVVGAPQMISQPVSSIFPSSPLPSWTWRTPGLSNPWCCLPTSSSVSLVFFPLSLCLARWFWSDLMNGRHEHATVICVSWAFD